MLFQPSKTKHRKAFKGRIYGDSHRCSKLSFGSFGIKTLERYRLTAQQIESARRAITHFMKRTGKVWIRVFPNVPVSQKPAEVRMGKGKGSVEFWVARVKPGRILFEVGGVTREVAEGAFAKANSKLPVKTRFVDRGF